MMSHSIVFLFLILTLLSQPGASQEDESEELRQKFREAGVLPIDRSSRWINPGKDPLFEAKVALGRQLFHDPRLSRSGTISCARCHSLSLAGTDSLTVAVGIHGIQNPHHLNSPTVLNSSLNSMHFWDGRSPDLKNQAGISFGGNHEMAFDLPLAIRLFRTLPAYQESLQALYQVRFPEKLGNQKRVQQGFQAFEALFDAIAKFEEYLLTPSPFDEWLKGNSDILSGKSFQGARLFVELGCVDCHDGPGLGGRKMRDFPRFGTYDKGEGNGYLEGEQPEFKVPGLRNVLKTPPYLHNGSAPGIEVAIRLMGKHQLEVELNEGEVQALKSFLESLNGNLPHFPPLILPTQYRNNGENKLP